jgi:hypothetical protein
LFHKSKNAGEDRTRRTRCWRGRREQDGEGTKRIRRWRGIAKKRWRGNQEKKMRGDHEKKRRVVGVKEKDLGRGVWRLFHSAPIPLSDFDATALCIPTLHFVLLMLNGADKFKCRRCVPTVER